MRCGWPACSFTCIASPRPTHRCAEPFVDRHRWPKTIGFADRAAVALGLKHTPRIRLSDEIEAPLVTGMVRPVVLIPPSAIDGLSLREHAMVIGHELAHIRRRDLRFVWVPAIVERLFFFHPLARLAAREYAAERESACDAIVLDTMDVAPQEYGRMLVRLSVAGVSPVFTVGGSSLSVSALKRRLDVLHDASSLRSSHATIALVILVAMLAVLPLRVVARVATRPNAPESANVERAVAEHEHNILQMRNAFIKLQADMAALYAREREAQSVLQRQQADSLQATLEDRQFERGQELAAKEAELETTKQLLESGIDLLLLDETADEKRRSGGQRHGETELRNHETTEGGASVNSSKRTSGT